MPQFLVDFFNQYGYFVVFFGAMLDNLGIPSAGDIALLVGGVLAAQGQFVIAIVIIAAILGALIGDNGSYLVGRFGGRALVRGERRIIRISESLLDKAETFFFKHGSKSVFLGRFAPGMRSLAPFLAGLNKMPWPVFFFSNFAAVIIWATGIGLLAFFFGANWDELMELMKDIRLVILIVIAVGAGGALLYWYTRRRRPRPDSD